MIPTTGQKVSSQPRSGVWSSGSVTSIATLLPIACWVNSMR